MALPGMASKPMSKVELRISCRKLIITDITSKSDPCAVLFVKQGGDWVEHGRTENIQNSLDPDFAKAFAIDYMFEEVQNVKVAVYDLDNTTPNLGDDDFLGQVECTLGQIVAARPFHKPVLLKNGKPAGQGSIIIRSEEVKEGGEVAVCTFRARKLENKDGLFGKSDPFLEIRKGNPDGSWQVVHRTEVVKNNLNPHWRPFTVPVHSLCGGDKSKLVKFDVYDYDSDGSHDLMGGFTASMQELEASQGKEFPCIEEKKKAKKKKYENSGFIILDSIKVKRVASFLEFIYGGTQINFTVGVDFTGSNGDPSSPDSLHYINPYQPNEYMQAIQAVGMVCQDYDSDKMFPALGFGAKLPTGAVSHEFAMNFNPQNPFCAGIQGIVQAYQNCVPQIQLWGPTNVAPIIHHVAQFAAGAQQEEQTKGAHAYYVLLLLTDGVITDMDETRSAIVHASALPMSLIIVGVGGADFTDMQMLDGDDGVLKAPNGQPVHRDIVQFVPFRDFNKPNNPTSSAAELARHVLAEVPQQVTHYYNWRGMQPNQAMAPPM